MFCFTIIGYHGGDKRIGVRYIVANNYDAAFLKLEYLMNKIEQWESWFVYESETC